MDCVVLNVIEVSFVRISQPWLRLCRNETRDSAKMELWLRVLLYPDVVYFRGDSDQFYQISKDEAGVKDTHTTLALF